MALAKDLMAVGISAEPAKLLGLQSGTVTSAGTTSADAAVFSRNATLVQVTGAASSGVKLPADAPLGVQYVLANISANAILIYPPTGGNINGDTTTTGTVPLAARGTTMVMRVSNTDWVAVVGAAG